MYQPIQRTLTIEYHVPFGQCLYLMTSLENWDLDKAIKMQWTKQDAWVCKINIPKKVKYFEYKYVVANFETIKKGTTWERGPNRVFDLTKIAAKKIDKWEQRHLNFFLQSPFDLENQSYIKVYLMGNCNQLNVPRQMKPKKFKDRTILQKSIEVNYSELENPLQYRYYIIVLEKSTECKGLSILNIVLEFHEFLSEQKEFRFENKEQLFIWDNDFSVNQIFMKEK